VLIPEETLRKLRRRGWSIVHDGKKSYLALPGGDRRLEVKVTKEPTPKPKLRRNLYVLHSTRSTRFKIGISANPSGRVRQLQTGSADRLEIVWFGEIEHAAAESFAHNAMQQHHIHGEWFDLGQKADVFRRDVADCEAAKQVLAVCERFGA
jgi:T5orf172 domain